MNGTLERTRVEMHYRFDILERSLCVNLKKNYFIIHHIAIFYSYKG